jgi:hypothetical protein
MRCSFTERYNWMAKTLVTEYEKISPRAKKTDLIAGSDIFIPSLDRKFTFKTTWHDNEVSSEVTGIVLTSLAYLSVFYGTLKDSDKKAQLAAKTKLKIIIQECLNSTQNPKRAAWNLLAWLADELFQIKCLGDLF